MVWRLLFDQCGSVGIYIYGEKGRMEGLDGRVFFAAQDQDDLLPGPAWR
jgi:hypothetical protein